MAKPNLTSIFTSTNQYSVLKLLKALCDAVDNIDYTDNSEFTKFKEQINSAIASLNSTDDSLQEQIDNNLNSIGDINAQISILERPDANTTVVNKGITVKGNGDVTVGRNLEVDGKTKLNSGFTFIHKYSVPNTSDYITVYFEYANTNIGENNFIGTFKYGDNEYLCFGTYHFNNNNLSSFSILYFTDSDSSRLSHIGYSNNEYSESTLALYDDIPDVSNLQPKLYRHVISLSNDDLQISGAIVYISSSNLKVDSLQDLTTLLKPSGSYYWYPLSSVLTGLNSTEAASAGTVYIKSHDRIVYENSTWSFTGSSGTKDAILSVFDIVTTL